MNLKGALPDSTGDDELTMEEKFSIVQEHKAKTAVLKPKSRAFKLKKKAGEAAKETGVIVPIALHNADDEDGPLEEITNEEAISKHLKLEMSIDASATTRVNPFNESTEYFDWLNFEKTCRGLSPAEEQYLVTASLAGHVFNKRTLHN
ncbi:hypothetical protein Rs2_38022 [Raphanus sativus]|nr:hypothetical protein Rs2_38022 [Raphanus sativus]